MNTKRIFQGVHNRIDILEVGGLRCYIPTLGPPQNE